MTKPISAARAARIEKYARAICEDAESATLLSPDKQIKDDDHGSTFHLLWEEHAGAAVAAMEIADVEAGALMSRARCLESALCEIAFCEKFADDDVVDIARRALGLSDADCDAVRVGRRPASELTGNSG